MQNERNAATFSANDPTDPAASGTIAVAADYAAQPATSAARTRDRLNELDLLRFLAALAVVFYHYAFRGHAADGYSPLPYPLLAGVAKYGSFGVELFFLISGFVILMSAAGGTLRSFAISRAVRLYPAFWVACTATFTIVVVFGGERFDASFRQYLINMTMLNGFFNVKSIDGVYWSLFVEIKFYALVALVLVSGLIHRVEWLLVLWLAATIALAAVPPNIAHALLITEYAPYFIGGGACYLVWSKGPTTLRVTTVVVAWAVALVESAGNIAEFERHYATSLDGWVVAGIVTALFSIMFLIAMRRTGFLGRRRWLVLGALTYPLYLLHQVIGYIIFNTAYPAFDTHLLFWGTVALMLFAAHGVHALVERPLAPRLKRLLNAAFDSGMQHSPRAVKSAAPVNR